MDLFKIIIKSIFFYWRTNLGVLLGTIIAGAILTGSLLIGDSVRNSLLENNISRIGNINWVLFSEGRFFREELGKQIKSDLLNKHQVDIPISSVMVLRGSLLNQKTNKRIQQINVIGIEQSFWEIGGVQAPEGKFILNETASKKIETQAGERLLIRFEKPDKLPGDSPLSKVSDWSYAQNIKIDTIVTRDQFGDFSLQANQVPPFNIFVPLDWLQERSDRLSQVNLLLTGETDSPDKIIELLNSNFKIEDAEIYLEQLPESQNFTIKSQRVFIDQKIGENIREEIAESSYGILTYFVNEFSNQENKTPYSMLAATDHTDLADLKNDEILITEWLAEDLDAKPGDLVSIKYFHTGPMRVLQEKEAHFKVTKIVPNKFLPDAKDLMPDFPGFSDAENCRDWDPGIEIDLEKIREKDEVYWDEYKGTPKAYINLKSGQQLWENRFGNLTAIRVESEDQQELRNKITSIINPTQVGLNFISIREQVIQAGKKAIDFSQLFLGFSMFLIGSALILISLLFRFGIEQRAKQIGLLKAVGFQFKEIRNIFLYEGFIIAATGSLIGIFLGSYYTKVVLSGLSTIWSDAINATILNYHGTTQSLIIGFFSCLYISLFSIFLILKKQLNATPVDLLSGESIIEIKPQNNLEKKSVISDGLFMLSGVAAIGLILIQLITQNYSAGIFYLAGLLLLYFLIGASMRTLRNLSTKQDISKFSISSLAVKNNFVRTSRSKAVLSILAAGCFMVIGIISFTRISTDEPGNRKSGTGGFTFYAESAFPVYNDLNTDKGLENFSLSKEDLPKVKFLQMRMLEGDDASCLNLNRAQKPRLLGVEPDQLQSRDAFQFTKLQFREYKDNPWNVLNHSLKDNVIPAIGDQASMQWALGLSVGNTIEYTNEQGETLNIQLVGTIADSILQGSLIISEDNMIKHYPSQQGYRVFLIDSDLNKIEESEQSITDGFKDIGMEISLASDRLNQFFAVQNTYLLIFLVLGGLGVLLGTFGFGVVLMRNVLERKSELAIMRATGYNKSDLFKILFTEHFWLLFFGLLSGTVAALIAIIPAIRTVSHQIPYQLIAGLIVLILANGLLWLLIATNWSLKENLIGALRNE